MAGEVHSEAVYANSKIASFIINTNEKIFTSNEYYLAL